MQQRPRSENRVRSESQQNQRQPLRQSQRPATKQDSTRVERPPSNVVLIRPDRPYKFYVFLVKRILADHNFNFVELHGAGERGIYAAVRVS